jgi:iron complex outermembrane receptor protein
MAYMPKKNQIAGACALLLLISSQSQAQTETELSPVVVTGEIDGLISQEIQAGFGGKWIDQTKSVNAITREQIDKTMAQKTSEVLRNDASVQSNYAPLGYYEGFSIRGFGLDYGTAYQVNGMPLAAEANIPLENKERVEVIKGISGAETGAISPGGYLNFVTKRPTNINSASVGYGERGSFSQAADYGRWLDKEKKVGIRLNAAHEEIKPYAKEATGNRQFISASIDFIPSVKTRIETDFDYQKKKQFTQPGLQLLGGTTLPPLNPEQVLAVQPWRKPTTTEQTTFGTRLAHELENGWKLNTGYQISRIVTSDNSSFPWGCKENLAGTFNYDSNGNYGRYPVNSNNFCNNGDFTISDFHSDGEIHQNQQGKIELSNKIFTNDIEHDLNIGASRFHRRVAQPKYVWTDAQTVNGKWGDLSNSNDTVVPSDFAYGNIYTSPNGASIYPSAATYASVDKFGYSNTQDSIYFNNKIDPKNSYIYFISGKLVNSREEWATPYKLGNSDDIKFLPSFAIQKKVDPSNIIYTSYSKGLELGGRAPAIASNANTVLPIKETKQVEIGYKSLITSNLQSSIAIFEISKPYEYTTTLNGNYDEFVQRGTQKHTGLELGLSGRATNRLNIQTSAMLINAVTEGTGDQFDGMKAMNVPKFKLSSFAAYKIPNYENTSINGGWVYEGSKYAKRDNSVKVPGYHRIDAGLTQSLKVNDTKTTLNFYVENIFDKGYWRDTSEYLGDAYLIPGAPRIFRASVKFDF